MNTPPNDNGGFDPLEKLLLDVRLQKPSDDLNSKMAALFAQSVELDEMEDADFPISFWSRYQFWASSVALLFLIPVLHFSYFSVDTAIESDVLNSPLVATLEEKDFVNPAPNNEVEHNEAQELLQKVQRRAPSVVAGHGSFPRKARSLARVNLRESQRTVVMRDNIVLGEAFENEEGIAVVPVYIPVKKQRCYTCPQSGKRKRQNSQELLIRYVPVNSI